MRAGAALEGKTVRGDLSVYCGVLLVADLQLSITIDSKRARAKSADSSLARDGKSVSRYGNIFASYSHADAEMVARIQDGARTLGHDYLMDTVSLRAGERWNEALQALIERADVFQLFWSSQSMHSEFVQREWHSEALAIPSTWAARTARALTLLASTVGGLGLIGAIGTTVLMMTAMPAQPGLATAPPALAEGPPPLTEIAPTTGAFPTAVATAARPEATSSIQPDNVRAPPTRPETRARSQQPQPVSPNQRGSRTSSACASRRPCADVMRSFGAFSQQHQPRLRVAFRFDGKPIHKEDADVGY